LFFNGDLRLEADTGEIFLLPEAIVAVLQRQLGQSVGAVGLQRLGDRAEFMGEEADAPAVEGDLMRGQQ
jgi:hypothetical protein